MGKPANNAPDLSDLLSVATEAVNTDSASDFTPLTVEAPAPTIDDAPDDFGPEPEATETNDEPTADAADVDAPTKTPADARKSAERWISFVDNLQRPMLIAAYRKNVLHPGDTERITEYEQKRAARGKYSIEDAVSEDTDFYHVLARAKEFSELCDKAAFTADEKETLAGPLSEVLEKYTSLQVTPEVALLLAVAMVMLPRIAPLVPLFRKGFTL